MKALLSIKPEFASKIFDGTKKYEFRRILFKRNVTSIVVYVSSPVQRVIGEFSVAGILFNDLDKLWKITSKHSGISRELFFTYFSKKESGYAIRIGSVRRYRKALCIKKDFGCLPPQSFLYLPRN